MNPTPQAITAAERLVRQQTGVSSWRYSSGHWSSTQIDPATSLPRTVHATPTEAAHFNRILDYYKTVYPGQRSLVQRVGSSLTQPLSLSSVGHMATGALGMVTGAAGGLVGGALGVAGHIGSSVLGIAGGVAIGALGVIGTVTGAFIAALRVSVTALTDFARHVTAVSDETGMGRTQSLSLVERFRSMGIRPEQTAQIFGSREMSPELFNMRAGALGAPDLNRPDFGPRLATWFQEQAKTGLGGFLSARARLDALFGGSASPDILRLANTRPELLQQNLAYGQNLQSKLGVSPEVIRRASEDLPLLQERVATFIQTVQTRFAGEMLHRQLAKVSDFCVFTQIVL